MNEDDSLPKALRVVFKLLDHAVKSFARADRGEEKPFPAGDVDGGRRLVARVAREEDRVRLEAVDLDLRAHDLLLEQEEHLLHAGPQLREREDGLVDDPEAQRREHRGERAPAALSVAVEDVGESDDEGCERPGVDLDVIDVPATLVAPIAEGQPIAELAVSLGDSEILRTPVRALEDNPTGSLWQRLRDTFSLWFE